MKEIVVVSGKGGTGKTSLVAAFAALLQKCVKALRTHEEQENELMLVAYWQDLGEAD